MNNSVSDGAIAIKAKSIPSPAIDSSNTGRRPKRSDNAPVMGEHKNCMRAHAVPKTPSTYAARAGSPPSNCSTSFGSTGMIKPNDNMSISTTTNTNPKAARDRAGGAPGGASVRDMRRLLQRRANGFDVEHPKPASVRGGDEKAVARLDDEFVDADRRQVAAERRPRCSAVRRDVHALIGSSVENARVLRIFRERH